MTKLSALANKVSAMAKRLRKLEKTFNVMANNMNQLLPLIINFAKVLQVLKDKGIVTEEDYQNVEEPITSEPVADSEDHEPLRLQSSDAGEDEGDRGDGGRELPDNPGCDSA